MGVSSRMFLLDQDDGLYRLPNTQFDRMRRDPASDPILRFAGARVRMADVVVELVDRQPIRVLWRTFGILTFDEAGCFDPSAFDRHQRARAELALAPPLPPSAGTAPVVDASMRFAAQGGRWVPTRTVARRIDETALDRVKCLRL
jgi:hypothetical protein